VLEHHPNRPLPEIIRITRTTGTLVPCAV